MLMINLEKYFSKAFVINLDSRPERYAEFCARAKAAGVTGIQRVRGVDGDKAPPAAWWRATPGSWGCVMSHLRIAQDAIMDGLENYLVFEDDAVFSPDFAERVALIAQDVTTLEGNWDMLYLGGQHLYKETSPPWPYNGSRHLLRCNNVNRTHAIAVNKQFMQVFVQQLTNATDYMNSSTGMHIDHQLGIIHRKFVTLAVNPWLCGQGGGLSNISGKVEPEQWWPETGWNAGEL
jgi:GR25 family glycosyltransferase involved in LPS biosynthesis